MTEVVSHRQILDAIAQLRQDVKDDIAEIKTDNKQDTASLWLAITKLNDEMSTGRGAVKALVWVGATLIAIGTLTVASFNAFRH